MNTNFINEEEVLTKYANIFTKTNLYKACRYKGLPFYKNGKKKFYNEIEINVWIEKQRIIKEQKPIKKEYSWV